MYNVVATMILLSICGRGKKRYTQRRQHVSLSKKTYCDITTS